MPESVYPPGAAGLWIRVGLRAVAVLGGAGIGLAALIMALRGSDNSIAVRELRDEVRAEREETRAILRELRARDGELTQEQRLLTSRVRELDTELDSYRGRR